MSSSEMSWCREPSGSCAPHTKARPNVLHFIRSESPPQVMYKGLVELSCAPFFTATTNPNLALTEAQVRRMSETGACITLTLAVSALPSSCMLMFSVRLCYAGRAARRRHALRLESLIGCAFRMHSLTPWFQAVSLLEPLTDPFAGVRPRMRARRARRGWRPFSAAELIALSPPLPVCNPTT